MPDRNPYTRNETAGSLEPIPGTCASPLRRRKDAPPDNPTRYCANRAVMKNGRCRLHGGATPGGIALPQFKHGAFSRYMPQRFRTDYEAAMRDPHLLSLRTEISTHRAFVEDLKRQLEANAGVADAVFRAWGQFKAATKAGKAPAIQASLAAMDEAMTQAATERSIRSELRREDELIQKLTRAENDQLEQLHQQVSREQALAYMRGLSVSVREAVDTHVTDEVVRRAILRAVSTKFEQLTDRRGAEDARPRGWLDGAVVDSAPVDRG